MGSAVGLILRGLERCQLLMTATHLFQDSAVDNTFFLSGQLPNSHHSPHSPLGTVTPINDPAGQLLMIGPMTLRARGERKFIYGNRSPCCITLNNKMIMTNPGSVSVLNGDCYRKQLVLYCATAMQCSQLLH